MLKDMRIVLKFLPLFICVSLVQLSTYISQFYELLTFVFRRHVIRCKPLRAVQLFLPQHEFHLFFVKKILQLFVHFPATWKTFAWIWIWKHALLKLNNCHRTGRCFRTTKIVFVHPMENSALIIDRYLSLLQSLEEEMFCRRRHPGCRYNSTGWCHWKTLRQLSSRNCKTTRGEASVPFLVLVLVLVENGPGLCVAQFLVDGVQCVPGGEGAALPARHSLNSVIITSIKPDRPAAPWS